MKTIKVYEATENSDRIEGLGHTRGTGIAFKEKEDALKFVMSEAYEPYTVMGYLPTSLADAERHVRTTTIIVYDDMEDYGDNSEMVRLTKLQDSALAKLSDDEFKALIELGILTPPKKTL